MRADGLVAGNRIKFGSHAVMFASSVEHVKLIGMVHVRVSPELLSSAGVDQAIVCSNSSLEFLDQIMPSI